MIFHNYNHPDYKDFAYAMVNNDFIVDKHSRVADFSTFNLDMIKNLKWSKDFIDNSSPNLLTYFVFQNPNIGRNRTYFFKKNKLYKFGTNKFADELGSNTDQYNDIWYDPFLFVLEKDYDQAIRYLKLKNINK